MRRHIFILFVLVISSYNFAHCQHIIIEDSVWIFVSRDKDTCIESITQRHPKTEKIFEKAKKLYTKGKKEKAKILYDKAVEMDPKYYEAIMARAEFHEANKQFDLAIEEYTLALKILPCEKKPHLERGRVHLIMEHWDPAIQDFQTYLKWSTVNPKVYPMIAAAMFATKDDTAGCEFLLKGMKLKHIKSTQIYEERCK